MFKLNSITCLAVESDTFVLRVSLYLFSNFVLLRSILIKKQRTFPIPMKIIRTSMKIRELVLVPNPIMSVNKESAMKAQIKDPPFSNPVT